MHFIATILMFVLLLSACASAIGALEAWRMSDLRTFKVTLACAIPLSLSTVALFVVAGPPDPFVRSAPPGFGPGWHCLGTSRRGGPFCVHEVAPPAIGER